MHNPTWLPFLSHPLPWMLKLDANSLGFDLTPQVMQGTMLAHSLREWARVHKYFEQSPPDVAAGRDTLVHLLRTYVLATQLVTNRRVVDYAAAETIRVELEQYDSTEWKWWRDLFEPRMEAMHRALRAACKKERDINA